MSVDPKFIIKRGGKDYILKDGLIELAHQRGLHGIDVEHVQLPSAENGNVAIFKATVIMRDDEEGMRRFTNYGDASASNVSQGVASHFIRMAATRSVARALRDALSIGMVSLEELGDESEPKKVTTLKPGPPLKEELPPDDDELGFWVDQVELLLEAFGDSPPSPPKRAMRAALEGVEEARNVVRWLRSKAAERGVLPDDSANPDSPEED